MVSAVFSSRTSIAITHWYKACKVNALTCSQQVCLSSAFFVLASREVVIVFTQVTI